VTRPVAVVDTSVILLLLDEGTDAAVQRRRGFAELTIENLEDQNARFTVPAPVVAELCRRGPGSEVLREVVGDLIRDLRIEVLDEDAAVVAGDMSRAALQARGEGDERGAIKFDALIAGVAHKINAKWLVTANARDFNKYLKVVNSTVAVVRADEQVLASQQVMIEMIKPTMA
jgi:predicted nucleic acid-binding protein